MPIVSRSAEIAARVRISELWTALGGGELRGGRGRAFWRAGDGFNVSLNDTKNCYFDHAQGEGGGVLDLVQRARDCDRKTALAWLADFAGVPLGEPLTPAERRAWAAERRQVRQDARLARWWSVAAAALAESVLEELPSYALERARLTRLLRVARDPTGRVGEFKEWRRTEPEFTAAMVRGGRDAERRRQVAAARFVASLEAVSYAA